MDKIRLKDFRCFRKEQTARLAPLTLLVGENSTGKTSFLAMIRVLWDIVSEYPVVDFKKEPYDLGSFDEIAHYRGGRGGRADSFEAGFEATPGRRGVMGLRSDVTFIKIKNGSVPVLGTIRFARENVWLKIHRKGKHWEKSFGTPRGGWRILDEENRSLEWDNEPIWRFYIYFAFRRLSDVNREPRIKLTPLEGSGPPTDEDLKLIEQLAEMASGMAFRYPDERLYASAPVRSKPRRTYDPSRTTPDAEGDYIPMYLANLCYHHPERWNKLKKALEEFGKQAGIFDEIDIRRLGKRDSEPFQVQVRKSGRRLKGPLRNLIDVGYGVSQVLPVITELLQENTARMFLLQQPEVHLHPSAQAALGSLFCRVAGEERQLIVETHSDHLLDRVRMDVRDGEANLKPEDVSILFFERDGLDVSIHSLRLDDEGNVLDAPDTYRKFFMEETSRSLGLFE